MNVKKKIMISLLGIFLVLVVSGCANSMETVEGEPQESESVGTGLPPVNELILMEEEEEDHEHVYQSDYFDENGFFVGLNTLDYITIENYESVQIPDEVSQIEESMIQAEINQILANAGIVLASPEELTDEYIAEISGGQYASVEAFESVVVEGVIQRGTNEYINTALLELAVFNELPTDMLTYFTNLKADEIIHTAINYGMTTDGLLMEMGFDGMDDFLENEKSNIEELVKVTLVVQYIAEKEKLEVSGADIDAYFGGIDWSEYKNAWGENYIKSIVLSEKVNNFFVDK